MDRKGSQASTWVLLVAVLLVEGGALATPLDDALARIEAARAGVQTVQADFTQDKVMSLFAERIRSSGRLSLRRPDQLRWELTSPDASVFVLSGRVMKVRLPGARADLDVRTAGALGVVLRDLIGFLAGPLSTLRARYRLELAPADPAGRTVLVATPVAPEVRRSVSRLRLAFSRDGRRLEAVTIEEPNGDRSELSFRNVRFNQRLAPDLFTLGR